VDHGRLRHHALAAPGRHQLRRAARATEGADDDVRGVQGLWKIVKGAERRKVIVDGDDVFIVYDLVTDTAAGTIPTAGWYHVRDGRIASIRVFFDARPFEPVLGAPGT
jgi:hypothetical protein